eukprot:784616-Pleurochrysis_carterae.AAC.2
MAAVRTPWTTSISPRTRPAEARAVELRRVLRRGLTRARARACAQENKGWVGAPKPSRTFVVSCDWEGHVHFPVWATPAMIALVSVRARTCAHARTYARRRTHARTPMHARAVRLLFLARLLAHPFTRALARLLAGSLTPSL